MFRLDQYLRETVREIKKVSWPSREQTTEMTVLVLAVSIVIGVYIGVIDFIFQSVITKLL